MNIEKLLIKDYFPTTNAPNELDSLVWELIQKSNKTEKNKILSLGILMRRLHQYKIVFMLIFIFLITNIVIIYFTVIKKKSNQQIISNLNSPQINNNIILTPKQLLVKKNIQQIDKTLIEINNMESLINKEKNLQF